MKSCFLWRVGSGLAGVVFLSAALSMGAAGCDRVKAPKEKGESAGAPQGMAPPPTRVQRATGPSTPTDDGEGAKREKEGVARATKKGRREGGEAGETEASRQEEGAAGPRSTKTSTGPKSCFPVGKIPMSPYSGDNAKLVALAKAHGKIIDQNHGATAGDKALVDRIDCASLVDFSGDGVKDLVLRVVYKHASGWQIEPDRLLFYKTDRKPMAGKSSLKKKPYKVVRKPAGVVSLANEGRFAQALRVLRPGGGVPVAFGVLYKQQYTQAPSVGLYYYKNGKVEERGLLKTPGCSAGTGGCGNCKAKVQSAKRLPPRGIALKGAGGGFRIIVKGFRLEKCKTRPVKKIYKLVKGKLKAL